MRIYATLIYLFLYCPIAVIAVFSFNAGNDVTRITGFSWRWYGKTLSDPAVLAALHLSFTVAITVALIATFAGTMAALGLQGMNGRLRSAVETLVKSAVILPGVVIGITSLTALSTLFGWINPALSHLFRPGQAPELALGTLSLIAAHALFCMALVTLIVRASLASLGPSLTEASFDLNAAPFATFRQITLPLIFPATIAGFLLSFTFSFDDFAIANFVTGKQTTLPIYLYAAIRSGLTPEVNAIATMVLLTTFVLVATALILMQRSLKRLGR